MKKEAVERVLFDNYETYREEEWADARESLFELFGEENGWETADEEIREALD